MTDHDHEEHDHDRAHGHSHTFGWRAELEQMRHEARHFFLHQFDWRGQQPPEGFEGPRYYEPDEKWRLAARLDTDVGGVGDQVTLPTSTGQLRQMSVAGELVFEVDLAEHRLTAYRTHAHDGFDTLFVPFRDATSGSETYGAGRYVDLPANDEGDADYELDFNLAYNPTCVYSAAYDCPIPPPGNRLSVPVRAGEMMPVDH